MFLFGVLVYFIFIQLQIFVLLLASVLIALGQDDGRYRPTEAAVPITVVPRVFPTTTRVPVYRYNDPRSDPRYGWNSGRWSNDRHDPRYETTPRFDARYNPSTTSTKMMWYVFLFHSLFLTVGKPYTPRSYHDYRTIRLDEKVDSKGYRYVYVSVWYVLINRDNFYSLRRYETVGGILAEEVGSFENFGLKNEGVRAQGSVQITDPAGVVYRIDYQTDSKDAYIPRVGEAPRTPPSIVKLLSLLESHK